VGQIKKLLGILVIGGLLTASGFAFSQSSQLTAELKERLAPVGTLCKAGESCAAAPVAVSSGPVVLKKFMMVRAPLVTAWVWRVPRKLAMQRIGVIG
jgi:hypothetical protein